MKKLNNQELNALAQKIKKENDFSLTEDIIEKVQKHVNGLWAKFQKSNDYKILEKYKVQISLSMIFKEMTIGGFVFNTKYNYTEGSTISTDAGTVYARKVGNEISLDAIKTELILGQIDATDVDSLISKVKKSLKLT
jgi:hypothetical protein